jgi:hypothetical protein
MTVNHEIKSHLARLLATEDLVVEHKKVQTACFNVHTRVLTLPMWEKASNAVYDLLVGHEVGHALYTPDEDWMKEYKVSPNIVNVVEDVRVEKLMKRRYAGLTKSFYGGYKELSEQDFFAIGDNDISTYNLADRANLYFKIGSFLNLQFTAEEKDIIDQIASTETFADVLEASKVLYKYCKKNRKKEKEEDGIFSHNPNGVASDLIDFDDEEELDDESDEDNSDDDESDDDLNDKIGGESNDESDEDNSDDESDDDAELDVKTMDSLEEALRNLIQENCNENVYLEIPQLDLKKIIVSNAEIHSKCKEQWSGLLARNEYTYEYVFGSADKTFAEFKRSAQKEVNYLVKEFECRKAADSYARATTARTGVLDCSKLHTYKFNENLFKKVTTLADSKSHGLVFVLDWSGSMRNVMLDTVKQLFNLIWFCKKVAIPFEVYAFTNEYPVVSYDEEGKAIMRQLAYTPKDGLFQVGEWFSMMNLLTHKTNSSTLEEQMKNIFRLAYAFSDNYYCIYNVPAGMTLSGTPLNESLITLHQILPKFQKENKLQKVQCVVLTDGEGCGLKYHREVKRHWEAESYVGTSYIGSNAFLRDRKTGNTYSLNIQTYAITDVLLKNLRDKFTDINFIGIRVLESRDSRCFIRRYYGDYGPEYGKLMISWKKEKSFSIKTSGYHSYFGLSASALSQDTEFDVAENATKTRIKSAFFKSLKSKKMNKKILGEFIQLIA